MNKKFTTLNFLFLILFLFITSSSLHGQCGDYELAIWDSWGDGFDGSSVEVTVNGNPVPGSPLTFTSGSGPVTLSISTNIGDALLVTYVDNGCCNNEHGWELTNPDGIVVGSDGTPKSTASDGLSTNPGPVPSSTPMNFTACPSPPGCATTPSPTDGATDIAVPDGAISLSWTAPTTGGSPSSYDINIGTSSGVYSNSFNSNTTSFSITGGLAYSTTYYWQVVPRNGGGEATGCPEWSFTTEAAPPPPINDMCSGAINIPVEVGACNSVTTGNNTNSTNSNSDPNTPTATCTGFAGGDIWFKVTVPISSQVTISGASSDCCSFLWYEIYEGSSCSNLSKVSCSNTTGNNPSSFEQTLTGRTSGETLWIRAWDSSNDDGPGNFNFCAYGPPPPPNCATTPTPADDATDVTVTSGAVTLTWVAPETGETPTSYDLYFGETSGSIVNIFNGTGTTVDVTGIDYSTTYYWRIVPKNGVAEAMSCEEWSFTTEADPFTPITGGETCADAVAITPGDYKSDGPSSGSGASDNCNTSTVLHADWYSFTPTENGFIDVSSCGGGTDTELSIFDTCGEDCIAGSGDVCEMFPGSNTWASEVTGLEVCAGKTYYIEWDDDYSQAAFNFTLTFTPGETSCPPPNDECADAIFIPNIDSGISSGTVENATTESAPIACGGPTPGAGVWHTFTYNETLPKVVTLTVGTSHNLTVYSGTCGTESCVALASGQGTSVVSFTATSNFTGDGEANRFAQNYFVYVQGTGPYTIGSSALLPVQLNYITGQEMEKGNKLQWETASELNTEVHVIERSADGRDNWMKIGEVAAAGTSNDAIQYELMDENPLPMSFYRLKSIDFDGYTDTSETVSIERKESAAVIAYPVPTTGEVSIQFQSPVTKSVNLELVDMTGRLIRNIVVAASKGVNTTNIDMSDLVDGVYFLAIENGEEKMVTRLIKQ